MTFSSGNSPSCLSFACALLFAATAIAQDVVPIPGPNVNMVSGTQWPFGDPFLQRQNEPSLGVSSRNPLHLLAGANDYRTVDLSLVVDRVVGDAWLGVFKSFDGGLTWRSTLLPGYPQDFSPDGSASPIKGFAAGADPTVRPGTNGLFYYSGIAFNRGDNAQGSVFVARFIDNNNKEGGDPIQYLGASVVDTGTAGQFLDKPWLAVDIPRSGANMCAGCGGQSFLVGNIYLTYSRFVGGDNSSKIMLTRSTDGGATWSTPIKVSEGLQRVQGTTITIDPITGAVYVAWRQFKSSNAPDAIVVAKSVDGGQRFTKVVQVALIDPFDQGSSSVSFRTNSFPTMTIDGTGRVYLAWTQRLVPDGDARIVLSTSIDGTIWTPPVEVDPVPSSQDNPSGRGHQIMPALASAGGKLMLVYYDLRFDSTVGILTPLGGGQFAETREPVGDLPASPDNVFNKFIADAAPPNFTSPIGRRHTMDLRAALAQAGPAPTFASAQVSQYSYGSPSTGPSVKPIKQLQFNPPNLPLFAQGTTPFMGDYVDDAAQMFLPGDTPGTWKFSTNATNTPVFHAAWTDNRDVRPPFDGNWTIYNPFGQDCASGGRLGMRNQNIYSARITQGLLVGSPQNSKPLKTSFQRAFVVVAQNLTNQVRSFRLTIANQPPGGSASFLQNSLLAALDVTVAKRSTISRTVFATSSDPKASVTVNVEEITGPGGSLVGGGLNGKVILNPDLTNPDLTNPDLTNPDITNAEVYNPDLTNPDLTNPDLTNPDITNPDITNPDITNPDITNPDITNPGIPNPDLTNPDLTNPDITNPDITNPDITNGSIVDATWKLTNLGNTSAAYNVKLLLNKAKVPEGFKLQLILHRVYTTPAAQNCDLKEHTQNLLVASIQNPDLINPDITNSDLTNPDITNPDITNATIALAPGEAGKITLRIATPKKSDQTTAEALAADSTKPLVIAQAANTTTGLPPVALIIRTASLPGGVAGQLYSQTLEALGGIGSFTWSLTAGSALPSGLGLSSAGVIGGTLPGPGIYNFTVQVTDSSPTPQSDTRTLSISVEKSSTSTTLSSSANPSVFGQSVMLTATVSATSPVSCIPGGTVTLKEGVTTLGTAALNASGQATFTISSLSVGAHSLSAVYLGSVNCGASTSPALTQTVNKASTLTSVSSSANPSALGQPVTITAKVTATPPGAGTPGGTITFKDGTTTLGARTLDGSGQATFTTSGLSLAVHSITAEYGGDDRFNGSNSLVLTQTVLQSVGYSFIGFLTPLKVAGTGSDPTNSGTFNLGKAIPIKWQLKNAGGAFVTSLSSLKSIKAIFNGPGCTGTAAPVEYLLYSPTSGATGGSTFRYDVSNNQFIFNWDTSTGVVTGAGCYTILLQLDDGAVKATKVQLK